MEVDDAHLLKMLGVSHQRVEKDRRSRCAPVYENLLARSDPRDSLISTHYSHAASLWRGCTQAEGRM